jgi:hypothetical protein
VGNGLIAPGIGEEYSYFGGGGVPLLGRESSRGVYACLDTSLLDHKHDVMLNRIFAVEYLFGVKCGGGSVKLPGQTRSQRTRS